MTKSIKIQDHQNFGEIPYRVHSKQNLFSTVFEKRQREIRRSRIFLLFFESGAYRFGLVYQPEYFSGHMELYAMSEGFEKLTDTGYRSIFTGGSTPVSFDEIRSFIFEILKDAGIDFENPEPLLLSLF